MIVWMMLWPIYLLGLYLWMYYLVKAFKRYPVLAAAVSTFVVIMLMNATMIYLGV